jgi:uncharacterized membrane protein SirB2
MASFKVGAMWERSPDRDPGGPRGNRADIEGGSRSGDRSCIGAGFPTGARLAYAPSPSNPIGARLLMLKLLHIVLAYLTVAGFVVRALWAFTDSPMRQQQWVRIAPHVIDTALLVLGVAMALQLGLSPVTGWLGAKLLGLLAYIGFGVLTLRASTTPLRAVGFVGALASVGYIFAVAFSRDPWPF